MFTGCRTQPVGEVDPAQIEAVVREYYKAFNNYDLGRIEVVFTNQAWKEEKNEISAWVRSTESMGLKSEFVSIASTRDDGSSILATVEVRSHFGASKDFVRLVRERGGWKIIKVLTQKVGQILPLEETPSGSSCCPQ